MNDPSTSTPRRPFFFTFPNKQPNTPTTDNPSSTKEDTSSSHNPTDALWALRQDFVPLDQRLAALRRLHEATLKTVEQSKPLSEVSTFARKCPELDAAQKQLLSQTQQSVVGLNRELQDHHLTGQSVQHSLTQLRSEISDLLSKRQDNPTPQPTGIPLPILTLPIDHGQLANLTRRVEALEKALTHNEMRTTAYTKFASQIYEQIKSLEAGTGPRHIWKIPGLNTILDNAKQNYPITRNPQNQPYDFCSPIYIDSPFGCRFFFRFYPNGCDSAEGTHASLFFALIPGPCDALHPWPYKKSVFISVLDQSHLRSKVTRCISYNHANSRCFARPVSSTGSLSVGLLHFISHAELFPSDSRKFVVNDTLFLEVLISDNPHQVP